MSLFQQQRNLVRQTILDISIQLFRKNGYDATTIEEIAKSVGIAKGTFYNFFSSKRDILFQWAAQIFQNLDFKQAAMNNRTIEQNLKIMVDLLVGYIAAEEILFKCFLTEFVTIHRDNEDDQFDFSKILTTVIENSLDYKKIEKNHKDLKINIMNDALFMGILHWLDQGKPATELKPYLNKIAHICLFGMLDNWEVIL